MNERIRELAAQAGYPDHMTYGQDKVLERFAELIVNECYNRAEMQYQHSGDEWDEGVAAVMASIEELFRN